MKQTLIWFNLQRDVTRNRLSNIKETFAESLWLQMSVFHQRMSIFQSSILVSQVHMMAGQNVKKKYLMCQIPIKMLKQHATSNSSFTKRVQKNYSKMNICSQLANTEVLTIRTFSRRYFSRRCHLRL